MKIAKEEVLKYIDGYFRTEEGKKVLITEAKTIGMIMPEEYIAIKKKKEELLTEKKNIQVELNEAKRKIESLEGDIQDIEELKGKRDAKIEELQELKKSSRELAKNLELSLKAHKEDKEKLDKTTKMWYEEKKGSALSGVLKKIGVKKDDFDLVLAAYRDRVEVRPDENGKLNVTITGDNDVEMTVDDFFKSWSEANKQRIIATESSIGGGAGGGRNLFSIDNDEKEDFFSKEDFVE